MFKRCKSNLGLLALPFAAAFVLAGCGNGEAADECPEGEVIDEYGDCVPAPVECELWEEDCCITNHNSASPGDRDCFRLSTDNRHAVCDRQDDGRGTCILVCQQHADCVDFYPERCGDGDCVCDRGRCPLPACSAHEDCHGEGLCIGGECRDGEASPDGCVIAPDPVFTREGETARLHAYAQKNGEYVVAEDSFTWESGDADVVTVADEGRSGAIATGGSSESTTTITANISGASCEVTVFNFAELGADEGRVLVLDEVDRSPIEDATVVLDFGDVASPAETDIEGVASFSGLDDGAMDVHVFAGDDYTYVSAIGIQERDLVIYLPRSPADTAGGIRGTLGPSDFEHISADNIHVALAGLSIPGNLIDMDLDLLVGEMIETHVQFQTLLDDEIPLPSGIVLGIGDQFFKEWYAPMGLAGLRTAWMIGGNLSISDVLEVAEPALEGDTDDIDIGPILASLLPMFERFWSGIQPGLDIVEGEVPESDSDWPPTTANFKQVPMSLSRSLDLKGVIDVPTLPQVGDAYMDGLIVLGGAIVEGQGLVPMGLTAGIDETGDGQVNDHGTDDDDDVGPGQLGLRMAPQHGGIEGSRYAALALALAFDALLDDDNGRNPISGYVTTFDRLEFAGSIDFGTSALLGVAEGAAYDETTRIFSPDSVDNANLYRASISGSGGRAWVVYHGGTSPFDLIDPDEFGQEDRASSSLNAQAVRTNGVDIDGLFGFNATNLDSIMDMVLGFSTIEALVEE